MRLPAKTCVCAAKLRPSHQFFEGTSPRGILYLCTDEAGNILSAFFFAHLPSVFLLLRQRCVRRKAIGAAGSGLGTTIKYLRRTRNGAAGSGLGTTINYL
jgi:hypothetical protein